MTTLDAAGLPKGRAWQFARTAVRDARDRWRLTQATEAGWSAEELYECARSRHRRRHSDTPSAQATRQAITFHDQPHALLWLKLFREHGSLPLPPRSAQELDYAPDRFGIGPKDRWWPWHSPDLIALIDQRARARFGIADDVPVSPKSWVATHNLYRREIGADPAPAPPKPKRTRKPRPPVAPHFHRDWPGHSTEFIAEVEERARHEFACRGLSQDREVTDGFWRYICHRDYEVTDTTALQGAKEQLANAVQL